MNPEETMERGTLRQLQLERLQATLNRVYRNVATYQRMFDGAGVPPERVERLEDIARLPFTDRQTLVANYPYGMFTVPLREVIRLHTTVTANDASIVLGYTRNDLKHWTDLTTRVLTAAGITHDDVVLITFDYGLVTGAFGLHYGAERLGASVVPGANLSVDRQLGLIQDYRVTALVGTPSGAARLVHRMNELGHRRAGLALRVAVLGSEPFTEDVRRRIEMGLSVSVFDSYGLGVVMGPGLASECEAKDGLHINEDHVYPEVVNPDTGAVLPAGETGELVLTNLTKEACPLIRYRTGDITTLNEAPCRCGRTFVRMTWIAGRTDERVSVGGQAIWPATIDALLREAGIHRPVFQLRIDPGAELDELHLDVEAAEDLFEDQMRRVAALRERIQVHFYERFRLPADVHFFEPGSVAKRPDARRVVDLRR